MLDVAKSGLRSVWNYPYGDQISEICRMDCQPQSIPETFVIFDGVVGWENDHYGLWAKFFFQDSSHKPNGGSRIAPDRLSDDIAGRKFWKLLSYRVCISGVCNNKHSVCMGKGCYSGRSLLQHGLGACNRQQLFRQCLSTARP